MVDGLCQPILLRLHQEATENRLETLRRESGKPESPSEGNRGMHNGRGTFVNSSRFFTLHPTSNMPHSGAPLASSSKYMEALPVPVVHPPLARITESDEEPHASTVGGPVPIESHGLYHDVASSTNLGSHELPSALYGSHLPAHGVTLDDWWTSFMHARTGTHRNSHPP